MTLEFSKASDLMRFTEKRSAFSSAAAKSGSAMATAKTATLLSIVQLTREIHPLCLVTILDAVKITISKENYLKTIAEAQSEGETVIAATLSRWLKVSAPAVTMAIKRLKRDGLIRVDEDGRIWLTEEGREIAGRV